MTRAAAHVRNLVGPVARIVRRPHVLGADSVPRTGGLLLLVRSDVAPGPLLIGALPRPVTVVSDRPWPGWAGALGERAGVISVGSPRRRGLRRVAEFLDWDALAFSVMDDESWSWAAYLHMRNAATVQAVAVLDAARPVVHLAEPRTLVPAVNRAGLAAVAESLRQYACDHEALARMRVSAARVR